MLKKRDIINEWPLTVPENLAVKFRTTATVMHFAQLGLFYCRTLYVCTKRFEKL